MLCIKPTFFSNVNKIICKLLKNFNGLSTYFKIAQTGWNAV